MTSKKKRGKSKELDYKQVFFILFLVLTAVLIFTFIDYLVHKLNEEYSVPGRYFSNKILYATLYSFLIYFFVRKLNSLNKSLIISGITVVLLQIRYFFEGYPLDFVFFFLVLHFIMLFVPLFLLFKICKE